jgi:hypothetical protein
MGERVDLTSSSAVKGTTRGRGRPSRALINRAKLAAVALAVVAFVSSLAGVVIANPGVKQAQAAGPVSQAALTMPAPPAQLSQGDNGAPLVMPQMPQAPRLRPLVRSRGS